MSLKVWRAYRLKRSQDLWPFVADVKRIGTEKIKEELHKIFKQFMEAVDTKSDGYAEALAVYEGNDQLARALVTDRFFREGYKAASVSMERSHFNFDVSVTFRRHKRWIYLIPYCDMFMQKTLDFLDKDPRIEDYHYQNQTDKPSKIPMREWLERAQVWEAITEQDVWPSYLTLELCNYGMYHNVNPFFDLQFKQTLYRTGEKKPPRVADIVRASTDKGTK